MNCAVGVGLSFLFAWAITSLGTSIPLCLIAFALPLVALSRKMAKVSSAIRPLCKGSL